MNTSIGLKDAFHATVVMNGLCSPGKRTLNLCSREKRFETCEREAKFQAMKSRAVLLY